VFFLFTRGLHLSVEFTGGTVMEVAIHSRPIWPRCVALVSGLGYADVQVQNFGTARDVMIRLPVQKGISSAQQSEQVSDRAQGRRPRRCSCGAPSSSARRSATSWRRTASRRWPWWSPAS
jgi:preprotein translocase subunit SecF